MYCYQKSAVITIALLSLTLPAGIGRAEVKNIVNHQEAFTVPLFYTFDVTRKVPLELAQTPTKPKPPEITLPQITIPKQPEITLPQITVPKQPEITLPQITVPKQPEITLPQITIPKQPEITLPQITVPKQPEITLPQITVPKPPEINPSQTTIPQPQELPGTDQADSVFHTSEEEEKKRRKREQQAEQARQEQLLLQEMMQREAEMQRQLDLLRRLPENLRAEVQVAFWLYQMGKYQEALQKLQWIVDAQKQISGGRKDEATTLTVIALVYNSLGRYSKALEYCEQALAIQRQIGDKVGVSIALNYQGLIHYNLGQYSKALNFYQQALTIAKQNGDKSKETAILVNIADAHISQKNNSQAIKLYEQALATLQQINDQQALKSDEDSENKPHEISSLEGQALSGIGEAYQNFGNYNKALKSYQQALSLQEKINNQPRQAETLRKIGTVYVNQNNYSQALNYYQQALKIALVTDDKVEKAKSLNSIGFVYINQGKYSDAEKLLFTAIETWESLRRGLLDDQKISIFENQVTSYQFLQQALVAQNKTNIALEIAERGRSRAFVELLASRLSFNSNNQTQTNIKPPLIKEIQKIAQQRSSTIVQYSIINAPTIKHNQIELRPSKLYIWVVKPTGEISFRQVDLTSNSNISFDRLIFKSRDLMRARGRNIVTVASTNEEISQRINTLQQLYQILIQPIVSELPQNLNQPVIFVPQGELFLLPFAALQDELGKYLIEKHTILTAPAIQVLQLTHQQKIKNATVTTKRPLVVGNPIMPSVAQEVGGQQERLSSLPGAEKEALEIGEILQTQALIGSSATETSIKRYITSAGIVHLATHGLLDDIKGFGIPGAIALTPDAKDDGLLTSSEIFDMKLNADLVVLSACDTGRGDIKGDGVIGLSRSLIAAGAPSVIVSLWAVSDDSTKLLMTNFYQNLQQNPNKAFALRAAMLTTMKKYPQPLNWAAFTLIGEAE